MILVNFDPFNFTVSCFCTYLRNHLKRHRAAESLDRVCYTTFPPAWASDRLYKLSRKFSRTTGDHLMRWQADRLKEVCARVKNCHDKLSGRSWATVRAQRDQLGARRVNVDHGPLISTSASAGAIDVVDIGAAPFSFSVAGAIVATNAPAMAF